MRTVGHCGGAIYIYSGKSSFNDYARQITQIIQCLGCTAHWVLCKAVQQAGYILHVVSVQHGYQDPTFHYDCCPGYIMATAIFTLHR